MKKKIAGVLTTVLAASLLVGGNYPVTVQEDNLTAASQDDEDTQSDEAEAEDTESDENETEDTQSEEAEAEAEEEAKVEADPEDQPAATETPEEEQKAEKETQKREKTENSSSTSSDEKSLLKQAKKLAQQYDYTGAISVLKNNWKFATSDKMQEAAAAYMKKRDACVEYPLEKITHVFFHSLIVDTSLAFDGDSDEAGYNQMMTTVSEFKKIIQSMYDKGYVLVSPHDMAVVNDDGTMSKGKIMLPEGKIPFVLSEDDVSYYHYMDGDGFATKMVIDDNGDIKCEYKKEDGTVVTGDYDVVPILDSFIKEHPDFSYHGRKGILAMTGYNGVFGYRTDGAYKTKKNLQDDQKAFLKANPDFNYEKEVKAAKKVAKALKKDGWEFASHTWGHRNATTSTASELKTDNKKWEKYVAPILGKTDMIIFAFGADIGDWEGYTSDNKKYEYYKSRGYRYFCNVDSSQYFVQITSEYFRQGRRNLDGYRMYYNPDMVSDLFDVSDVWDDSRPTPVPEM